MLTLSFTLSKKKKKKKKKNNCSQHSLLHFLWMLSAKEINTCPRQINPAWLFLRARGFTVVFGASHWLKLTQKFKASAQARELNVYLPPPWFGHACQHVLLFRHMLKCFAERRSAHVVSRVKANGRRLVDGSGFTWMFAELHAAGTTFVFNWVIWSRLFYWAFCPFLSALTLKWGGKSEYTHTHTPITVFALKASSKFSCCFLDMRKKMILLYPSCCPLLLSWRKERRKERGMRQNQQV